MTEEQKPQEPQPEEKSFEEKLFGDEDVEQQQEEEAPEQKSIDEYFDEPQDDTTVDGGEDEAVEGDAVAEVTEDTQEETTEVKPWYQTEYQRAKEKLRQNSPELHDQIYGELKAERRVEPAPSVEQSPLTPDDDPYLTAIRETVRNEVLSVQEQTAKRERLVSEYQTANSAFDQFVKEAGIEKEQYEAAAKTVSAYRIDLDKEGGWSAYADVMMKELQFQAMQNHLQTKTVEAQADAATKANTIKEIAQPSPGALPEPRALTKEQKMIAAMRKVGGSDASEEVFG